MRSKQDSGWGREVGEEDREPGRGRVMQRPVTMTEFSSGCRGRSWDGVHSLSLPRSLSSCLNLNTVAMGLLPRLSFLGSLYFSSLGACT